MAYYLCHYCHYISQEMTWNNYVNWHYCHNFLHQCLMA